MSPSQPPICPRVAPAFRAGRRHRRPGTIKPSGIVAGENDLLPAPWRASGTCPGAAKMRFVHSNWRYADATGRC